MSNDYIIVTDWEKVSDDDFYLSNEWSHSENKYTANIKKARKLQKNNELFYAYIVNASIYAIYRQMDASQVLVNDDCDVVINCESAIINNNHEHREIYNF